jgi:hypothetical protein
MAAYSLITELYENELANKAQIIQLGLKHQLATKFTSFVATAVNQNTAAIDTLKTQNIILQKPAPVKEKEKGKEKKVKKNKQKADKMDLASYSSQSKSIQAPISAYLLQDDDELGESLQKNDLIIEESLHSLPMASYSKSSAPKKSSSSSLFSLKKPSKAKKSSKLKLPKKVPTAALPTQVKPTPMGAKKKKMRQGVNRADEEKKSKSPPVKLANSPKQKSAAPPPPSSKSAELPKSSIMDLDIKESSIKHKAELSWEEEADDDEEEQSSSMSEESDKDQEKGQKKDQKSRKRSNSPQKVQHKDWKTLVITSQQFDGCWDEKALKNILGSSVYDQVAVAQKPTTCSEIKVRTSALALAILELKCMTEKTSWEVVANKARAFMSKMLVVTEKKDKDEILQMVLKFITQAKEILVKFI